MDPGAPKRSRIQDLVPNGTKVPIWSQKSPNFAYKSQISDSTFRCCWKEEAHSNSHCCALFRHTKCIMCMYFILSGPHTYLHMVPATFEGFVAIIKICNIIFRKRGGGGSKAIWNFSEKTSVLVGSSVPKPRMEVLLQVCRKTFF